MPSYFDASLTLDEAKQLYRKLARQNHPDILKDDGLTMVDINAQYHAFKLRAEQPALGVAAPAPNADPMTWFAAMKQAAQAASQASPEELRHSAQQAQAHAADTMRGAPPAASPPPAYAAPAAQPAHQPVSQQWASATTPTPPPYYPPPASQPSAAAAGSAAAPSTATATAPRVRRTRTTTTTSTASAQPRQTAAQRIAEKEEKDYQEARYAPIDKYHTRRYGDVVIFWEDHTWDCLECVAVVTPSNPRHEIRRNGAVVHTEPATRRWQAERKDVIERAKRMI